MLFLYLHALFGLTRIDAKSLLSTLEGNELSSYHLYNAMNTSLMTLRESYLMTCIVNITI